MSSIDISIDEVIAWGQNVGPTQISGEHLWDQWQLQVNSPLFKGAVILADQRAPIELDLEYIHLPVTDAPLGAELRFGSIQTPDPLIDLDPQWLPEMDMNVAEVFIGSRNFGRWDFQLRQEQDDTVIHIRDSSVKHMQVLGDVKWRKQGAGHRTELENLQVISKQFGDVQRAFRQTAAIEARKARFDLNLGWSGSPARFNYDSLNGRAKINIKDGAVVSDNAGALKAFGLLNFNAVSRRLKLDFSDLYESGIAFRCIEDSAVILRRYRKL